MQVILHSTCSYFQFTKSLLHTVLIKINLSKVIIFNLFTEYGRPYEHKTQVSSKTGRRAFWKIGELEAVEQYKATSVTALLL